MAEHPKTILESFEEMTVSPTAGSPCRAEGEAAIPNEPPPKDKINFQLEVLFKGQISKKSARILPTASLFDFLEKLTKKKYLPTTSALGGAPLRNDQIKILHGANKDKLSELPLSKWSEPLWNYGFRDKVNKPFNSSFKIWFSGRILLLLRLTKEMIKRNQMVIFLKGKSVQERILKRREKEGRKRSL